MTDIDAPSQPSLKQRLFTFASGCGEATVTCKHCGWSSRGNTDHHDVQDVFDRSNEHECTGVESFDSFRARDQRELEQWLARTSARGAV